MNIFLGELEVEGIFFLWLLVHLGIVLWELGEVFAIFVCVVLLIFSWYGSATSYDLVVQVAHV